MFALDNKKFAVLAALLKLGPSAAFHQGAILVPFVVVANKVSVAIATARRVAVERGATLGAECVNVERSINNLPLFFFVALDEDFVFCDFGDAYSAFFVFKVEKLLALFILFIVGPFACTVGGTILAPLFAIFYK